MERLVRAFPLLPGKRDTFHTFTEAMRERAAEVTQMYSAYGIRRESWHLQETPAGDMVIVVTDIADLKPAASAYAESTGDFDVWFKGKVLEFCGVDPNEQPLGPECHTVYDWQAAAS